MLKQALIALFMLGVATLAGDRDFLLPLKLQHAQLGEIFLGCQDGATDSYDREMDDLAPPHGMNTGYVGFVSRSIKNSLLYKDIKAHGELKEWEIELEVYQGKPLKISWQTEKLPIFYDLTFVTGSYEKDMRKVNELVFTTSQRVAIVAGFNPEAKAPAKATVSGTAGVKPPSKPDVKTRAQPKGVSEPPSSKRVAGGVSMLVIAMGALLLLIVIFAAVRR